MDDWAIDFTAGWISGAAGIVLTQPLDSVLVRLQAQSTVVGASESRFRSALGALLAAGGRKALWSGASPMLWSVPVQNALLFSGYGAGLNWCDGRRGRDGGLEAAGVEPSLWHVFAGGCAGGFVQSFVMSPVELVKVRLQLEGGYAEPAVGAGATTLAFKLVRESGLRVLSRGLGATMGRDVLPHGVWFTVYEGTKRELSRVEGVSSSVNGQLSVHSQLAAGATAATVAWLVGYPFDVIKTRLQGHVEGSVWSAARDMYQAEGGGVFWRGLGLKLMRAVPMSMIGFFAYETAAREMCNHLGTK
ncbi:unnamed protein product [Discosporangium mesarthrocarpum]